MPLPEMRDVQSSKVWQLGYDDKERVLYVRFVPNRKYPAGRVAIYRGVPPDVAQRVENATSVGSALSQFVEGVYPFNYQ